VKRVCEVVNLENEVAEGCEVGAVPPEQVTLYLLDSDGVLVLPPHLVDTARHADHALKSPLDDIVATVRRVVVVHDVLRNRAKHTFWFQFQFTFL